METFKDKVAIVTGGAMGIGRTLCQELAARGAIVIVADLRFDSAEQVAGKLAEGGAKVCAAPLDVSHEPEVTALIEKTASNYGHLDYMFNNAGVAIGGDARDLSLEHWRRVFDVNLYGVVYGTIAAYRVMARQGSGHIVNTSSAAGLLPQPLNGAYCASKHAVVGLSRGLRIEGADLGVRVSVICPGYVATNIYENMILVNLPREETVRSLPIRPMSPVRAAHVILHGVSKNKPVIVLPLLVRLGWYAYRLFPGLADRLAVARTRSLRNARAPYAMLSNADAKRSPIRYYEHPRPRTVDGYPVSLGSEGDGSARGNDEVAPFERPIHRTDRVAGDSGGAQ